MDDFYDLDEDAYEKAIKKFLEEDFDILND